MHYIFYQYFPVFYYIVDNKTVSMLNSTEHKIDPAQKCLNANSSWHFNI